MSASSTWCPLAPSFPSVSRAAVALRWGRKPYETGKKSASKTPPLAWGLLLGAPALTEAGLAPAGDTQRADAGLFGHPPSASRRTVAAAYTRQARGDPDLRLAAGQPPARPPPAWPPPPPPHTPPPPAPPPAASSVHSRPPHTPSHPAPSLVRLQRQAEQQLDEAVRLAVDRVPDEQPVVDEALDGGHGYRVPRRGRADDRDRREARPEGMGRLGHDQGRLPGIGPPA